MKIRTVYEKSYRPIKCIQSSYCENLTYRRLRTLTERSHQPLEWPDDSSDSESSSMTVRMEPNDSGSSKPFNAIDEPEDESPSLELSQTSNHENHPLLTSDESIQVGSGFSGISPASNSNSQKLNELSDFNMYGTGDLENINSKRTFNVKSSRDVHQSALRALENRRNGLSHSRSAKNIGKSDIFTKSINKTPINHSDNSAKLKRIPNGSSFYVNKADPLNAQNSSSSCVVWQSEYNSKYPTYPANIYSRSAKLLACNSRPHSASLDNLSRQQSANSRIDQITARMARNGVVK